MTLLVVLLAFVAGFVSGWVVLDALLVHAIKGVLRQ